METITKELLGLAAAGIAWAAGWAWSKIREDKRAQIAQVEAWARKAFDALEGVAARHPSENQPTSAEKEREAMELLELFARGARRKLSDSDRAFARTLWRALAAARHAELPDAERFAESLKRLATGALPSALTPSLAPPAR